MSDDDTPRVDFPPLLDPTAIIQRRYERTAKNAQELRRWELEARIIELEADLDAAPKSPADTAALLGIYRDMTLMLLERLHKTSRQLERANDLLRVWRAHVCPK